LSGAWNTSIIYACSTPAFWKIQLELHHLIFIQPIKIAHIIPQYFGEVNHAAKVASKTLMGPEPSSF
jgi:hypothetical protein